MAADRLNLALCQLNPTVGDLAGNAEKVRAAYRSLCRQQVDLAIFPELFVTGYPPEDLLLLPAFCDAAMETVKRLVEETAGQPAAMILGTIWREEGALYNAALFVEDGKILRVVKKHHLPNRGVFDEKRLFSAGDLAEPILWRGRQLGLLICEDMWHDDAFGRLGRQNCDAAIIINGSPFEEAKQEQREGIVGKASKQWGMNILYVNMVGGQDELVFDGNSFAVNTSGEVVHRSPAYVEDLGVVTLGRKSLTPHDAPTPILPKIPAMYGAAMLGLRDYIDKNGAKEVLIGLSGGIDSALVAAMAVDALGHERVRAVMLPYRYTSAISLEDAAAIAVNLRIRYDVLPIEAGVNAAQAMLAPLADEGVPTALALENLQSRLRGLILMSLSNSTGALLLTTGNKSEMAMGYATLYGDMCGAFNPLKDIYKSEVFELVKWRNTQRSLGAKGTGGEVIPERVITRPPSAELREDQRDEDSLPPYDRLDAILRVLIEGRGTVEQLFRQGHHRAEVERVARLLYASEYKRFQSPPGPKVSRMNFGRDRRYPMTSRFSV